jgi:hypothetical protein
MRDHAVTSVVSFSCKLPPTQSESQHGLPDANPLRSRLARSNYGLLLPSSGYLLALVFCMKWF